MAEPHRVESDGTPTPAGSMGHFIVGTAGHIDHGKSALVRALTGTDPDRLKEEQERGITIDLGFAHLELGEREISFIDVPGHERFVRNMLAGAHGIDAVLLVVAADESVMPQTVEHFHICRLLGVAQGLVALTKCDLADPELQSLAELEVRELARGSFLDPAEVVRCSARTGEGLDALRDALGRLAERGSGRAPGGLLRLPVDRVFTMRGFGTVVTGTLVSGELAVGDELAVLPSGRRARARGVQVHGRPAERVMRGHRTAVNLAGVDVSELARGDVLTRPGTVRATSMLDVELELLAGERALKDQSRVRVHVASGEVLGRVRLLDGSRLEGGGRALSQLRLERPVAAGRGDRIVLRSYSPSVTIGGARVLDPLPPKRRRSDRGALAELAALEPGDAAGAARLMISWAGPLGIDAGTLSARLTLPHAELAAVVAAIRGVTSLGRDPVWLLEAGALERLADGARQRLADFHARNPLKPGMPREELRRRAFAHAPPGAFERALERLAEAGELAPGVDALALAGHAVTLSPEEQRARDALERSARDAGLAGVELARIAQGHAPAVLERVARVLLDTGALRRVGGSLLVHADHLEPLKVEVRRRWPPGSKLDVGAFKELTGLTRKHVIPLLEHLDGEKVTRRAGADRYVL